MTTISIIIAVAVAGLIIAFYISKKKKSVDQAPTAGSSNESTNKSVDQHSDESSDQTR